MSASHDDDCYNRDELNAPNWLNEEFLTEVLQNCEEGAKIKDLKLTPASLKGDHYASVMFRATINYANPQNIEKCISLIIKTMPQVEGNKMDLLKNSTVFETEIGIYSEVIPKFEKILLEAGDKTQLGPRLIYHSLTPRKLIILEDLKPQNYDVVRVRGPTIDEVKLAYTKIAKWHAISYKLTKENPAYLDKYRYSLMSISNFFEMPIVKNSLSQFIDFLERTPSLRVYKPYFEALVPNFMDDFVKTFNEYRDDKQSDGLYALCHGDFHLKNMMFKHNPTNGKPEDVLLLDFQVSYVGPMVNDILYSTYLIMDKDLRLNKRDELIYYYFSEFQDTLKKIGFQGTLPKLLDFRQQMLRHKKYDLFLFYAFLPIWYLIKTGKVDIDDTMSDENANSNAYDNPAFVEECELLLPRFLHLGYFED